MVEKGVKDIGCQWCKMAELSQEIEEVGASAVLRVSECKCSESNCSVGQSKFSDLF